MLAVLLAMTAPDTHAAGFGEVEVASQLGERLYARVPLVGEGAADIATECVRLLPESVLQDAPALNNARVGIDRRSSPPAVVVSTLAPVMDPAVRFVLEMGCGNRFRREFVLLIDPPDLPAVQTAGTQGTVVPSAARVVPTDEPRWGSSAVGGSTAPVQSASAPVYDAPLAEPPVKAAPAPRKAAPKPRPKPAAKPQVAAQPQPASAPPPPVRAPDAPKPATTDRLVLADTDPAAASPPAPNPEQAARDARAEALNKQVEALTKEVARMREDMDKLSTRNRELVKEAESRTGWFAAAGLGIVIAGVILGLMGRREKKVSWRDELAQAGDDREAPIAAQGAVRPEARADVPAPKPVVTPVQSYYRDTGVDPVTDLDVTKLDVRESTGHGTIMNTTAAAVTTMFPSDIVTGTTPGTSSKPSPLQSLDFSLDDIDTSSTRGRSNSPVFKPGKPASREESEAARASLFEEIEKVHNASKKA